MKTLNRRTALASILSMVTTPLYAHTLRELKDEFYPRERYFEALDRPVPAFKLSDAAGRLVRPVDFLGKVTILHFIYSKCTDVCPLHAEKLAEVQKMINRTPMIDLVRFVSVTTDPGNDTADVLKDYGPQHGLDPINWEFLTIAPGEPEDYTRRLAQAFGHKFTVQSDGTITHGLVTHVIGKFGRWQGNFYGLEFQSENMLRFVEVLAHDREGPGSSFLGQIWNRF